MNRIPHTRGGEPSFARASDDATMRIPHTRGGEPGSGRRWKRWRPVFPTRVGVNRTPHARPIPICQYSPHAWG